MFDLAKEVEAWSRAVYANRCGQDASVAELSDHLYSEIERARAEGMSDQQAFAAAVAKLGPQPELQAELAKNLSLLATGCAVAGRYERLESSGRHRQHLIAHSIVWAALILASSLLLSKTAVPDLLSLLLIGIMLPSWWASQLVLLWALRQKPAGGA